MVARNKHNNSHYKKTLIKLVIVSILIVSVMVISALMYLYKMEYTDLFVQLPISVLFGFLVSKEIELVIDLKNCSLWETQLLALKRKGKINERTRIRVTFSYALIIRVDNKYLLVKNSHGLGLLQLPMRVYEIGNIEKVEEIQQKTNAEIDSYPKRDWLDWRFLVPSKKVNSFYKIFDTERKDSVCKCENIFSDLTDKGVIDEESLSEKKIRYLRRVHLPISYSRYTDHYEFNCVDLYELVPNNDEWNYLKQIANEKNERFSFCTLDEIKGCGVDIKNLKYNADIDSRVYDFLTIDE